MARLLFKRFWSAAARLTLLRGALLLVWRASPALTLLSLALILSQGILPTALVLLTRAVVDQLVFVLSAGQTVAPVGPLFVYVAAIAGVMLVAEGLSTLSGFVRAVQSERLHDYLRALVHTQAVAVDLSFYDNPEFYDHLHRARDEADHRAVELVASVSNLLQNSVTLIAMSVVLLRFGTILSAGVFVSTIPALFVVLRFALKQHDWRLKHTADERRTWYYDWLLTSGEAAPELRLFNLGQYFRAAYQHVRTRLSRERIALLRAQGLAELSAAVLALGITAACVAWVLLRVARHQNSLGDLALFYQAFSQGQGLLRSLIGNVGQIYANSLFLEDIFAYLALKPVVVDRPDAHSPAPNLKDGIVFERVSFRYPGTEKQALKEFDLKIPANSIVAIVGANGAGKSTLIKLLCRFYDPDNGRITLDGIDLRDLRQDELRRTIAVLFQQPMRYSTSARENVRVGDIVVGADDQPRIEAAVKSAGAGPIIAQLPHGYESQLGKWFPGGTELSVGEWQRLALARSLLRDAPILIMDEPTSAMDPWAEQVWLRGVRQIAQGRTVIVITHRLSTARQADFIYVLANGAVVESGTHAQLLATQTGLYATTWSDHSKSEAATQR